MANNKLALKLLINAKDKASSVFSKLRSHAGKVAAAIAGYFGVRFFSSAIDDAQAFEKQMDTVAAVSNATGGDLKKLEQAAKDMGATTQYTALESAQALESLARAGLSASEQIQALPEVLALAQANGISLGESAGFISKAIAGMGLQFSDAGRVADVLTKAAASANTSVTGLGSGLSYAAPLAQALGLSLESTVSYLAQLANAGIDASRAGTSLNAMMVQFQNPASKFRAELQNLGINTDDFNLALKQLAEKGDDGKAAILALGTEAGPALQALLNQGMPALQALQKGLDDSAGSAKKAADTMADNLAGIKRQFGSVVDAIKLQLAQPILEPFKNTIEAVADSLQSLLNSGAIAQLGESLAASFSRAADNAKSVIAKITDIYSRLRDNGVIATFSEQFGTALGAIKNLLSNLADSFSRLLAIVADTTSITTFGDLFSAVLIKLVESVTFLVNAFATGLSAIETAFHTVSAVGASFFSAILDGVVVIQNAMAKITFGDLSQRWAADAEKSRLIAESFATSAEVNFNKAGQALQATANNAVATNRSLLVLSGGLITTAKAVDQVADSSDKAAKQAEQLSSRVKKVGDQADISGKKTAAAADKIEQAAGKNVDAVNEVEDAFKRMGLVSQKALDETAAAARKDFDLIKNSGVASQQQIQQAFIKSANAAIAANDGVVSSAIKQQAAHHKVKIAVDEAGNAMVEAYANGSNKIDDATRSTFRFTEATNNAAKAISNADQINARRQSREDRINDRLAEEDDRTLYSSHQFTAQQRQVYSQLDAQAKDDFITNKNRDAVTNAGRGGVGIGRDLAGEANALLDRQLATALRASQGRQKTSDIKEKQRQQASVSPIAGEKIAVDFNFDGKKASGVFDDNPEIRQLLEQLKRKGAVS